MPNPNPMFIPKPFSRQHAASLFGGGDPSKIALLMPILYHDYGFFIDEFVQALDTTRWTTAVAAGGGPTAFAYSAVRGGVIQGLTGATDNDALSIYLTQTFLDPADNPFLFIQWRSNAVTGFSFEIGFSDPKTDEALPGVTDVDTPAVGNGVTDIACLHMDTDQTLTSVALVGDGTTGSAASLSDPEGAGTTYTPTASAWQTFIIGVRANIAFAYVWDGAGFAGRFSVGNGPDSAVLVRPYALFRTRNTVSKTIDIRKFGAGWEQND